MTSQKQYRIHLKQIRLLWRLPFLFPSLSLYIYMYICMAVSRLFSYPDWNPTFRGRIKRILPQSLCSWGNLPGSARSLFVHRETHEKPPFIYIYMFEYTKTLGPGVFFSLLFCNWNNSQEINNIPIFPIYYSAFCKELANYPIFFYDFPWNSSNILNNSIRF